MMSGLGVRDAMCVAAPSTMRLQHVVLLGMLTCVSGFLASCGGGGVAPVQAPSEPAIPGPAREHIVGKGETVYAIAWRHGLDYRLLARLNSIRDPYTIYPGQRLLIPRPGDKLPLEPASGEASSDRKVPGEVSTHGIGGQAEPAITPLAPPSPKPEMPVPATRSPRPEPTTKTAVRSPQPEPTTKTAVARPRLAPVRSAPPSPAEQEAESLPHRTVAGVRWTRPTRGRTIGSFAGAGGKGLDIAGAYEQPIRAAAQGRVVYAGGGLIGYGKLIILKHNARLLSAYAHNERLHVKEGDAVKGGHHIADMGRSSKGRSMLHFEIRRDGKPVDPGRYLP